MYIAKKNQQSIQFYTQSMQNEIIKRLELENDISQAVEKNQLEVYYQPIIDLQANKICDTEALVRWNHPTRGLLPPAEFITAAETGMINSIGKWVLNAACLQNKYWQDKNLLKGIISVNISSKQLEQIDFIDQVCSVLNNTGLPPQFLQLELTENRLIRNLESMSDTLGQLKKLGVKIAIDDFGAGYTGLSFIKHFPLDKLKIDKSLIKNIPYNSVEKSIVTAMISMCKNLHISVCVEGVETNDQYQYLREQSCTEGQGFFFSPPITATSMNIL